MDWWGVEKHLQLFVITCVKASLIVLKQRAILEPECQSPSILKNMLLHVACLWSAQSQILSALTLAGCPCLFRA